MQWEAIRAFLFVYLFVKHGSDIFTFIYVLKQLLWLLRGGLTMGAQKD